MVNTKEVLNILEDYQLKYNDEKSLGWSFGFDHAIHLVKEQVKKES